MENSWHLIEPSGIGGVFHHTQAFACESMDNVRKIVIHTSEQYEKIQYKMQQESNKKNELIFCECFNWFRNTGGKKRRIYFLFYFITRTLPHLVSLPRKSFYNIQGTPFLPALLLLVACLKISGKEFTFTPHNLFMRYGGGVNRLIYKVLLATSSKIIVFSKSDVLKLGGYGSKCVVRPLAMPIVDVAKNELVAWRDQLWKTHKLRMLFIGQIREDKGLSDLAKIIELTKEFGSWAIVGKATNSSNYRKVEQISAEHNVNYLQEYVSYEDFNAIVASADLVVLPYKVSTQSGVLEICNLQGVDSISYPVGNLGERSTFTSLETTPESISSVIIQYVLSKQNER